jgi:hypothetical protein
MRNLTKEKNGAQPPQETPAIFFIRREVILKWFRDKADKTFTRRTNVPLEKSGKNFYV